MPPGSPASRPQHLPSVHVAVSDSGGWMVTVERNGQTISVEHCDDWHRVERRVALLKLSLTHLSGRVAAAALLIVSIVIAPLAAQAREALLPEPRIIAKAVDLASGITRDDLPGPKDGFYAHTGQMITGAARLLHAGRFGRRAHHARVAHTEK